MTALYTIIFNKKKFNNAEYDNKPQTGKQNKVWGSVFVVTCFYWTLVSKQKASVQSFQFVHVSTTLVPQNYSLFYKKILWEQLSTELWRSTCTQNRKTDILSL